MRINKSLVVIISSLTVSSPLAQCETSTITKTKPNVLFILVDDLGWKDLGCTGSTFYETPAIDALASDGVRFSNAYAPHPVCGPSRCAILSGKAPLRIKNTGVAGHLASKEVTLAETFQANGYTTFFAGKWHCGVAPKKQGFDIALANNPQGQPGSYFFPYKDTGMDWPGLKRKVIKARDVPDLGDGQDGEYLTDRLTDETIKFIDAHSDKPFFAYLSHYAVHAPLESKAEYTQHFAKKRSSLPELTAAESYTSVGKTRFKNRQDNPIFAGMIKSLDDSVTRLVAHLKMKGIYENTIIVFFSDNGGIAALNKENIDFPTSNLPLRAGKGYCYEGGVRVPLIISYPQRITSARVSDSRCIGMDLYPTLLELAGIEKVPHQHRDGKSLVPSIQGEDQKDSPLYWIFPQAHASGHQPSAAILKRDYKLIHFLRSGKLELYNLAKDPAEKHNLSDKMPELSQQLKTDLANWRKKMTANK